MAIRKLKNGGRRKAPFGSQEAAILTAAGIGAAASLASAGIGASATKKAAQDQAKATITSAQKQAQAIKDQSAKSKEMQEQSQEFVREQNAENRELQKDIQLQLQMLTGQQNVNERLEASKIQVKNGGSTKRKLRLAGKSPSLLRGSDNMPFVVTDGGTVIPIGQTPEGYDMYEILGNDHEHYHKARGGKNKTGVGIKFADGNVIEGEGNQNTNQGEIMVNTPNNAYFISKHSIAGFNPAKMTLGGMHPLQAYAIQEQLKIANGISDDGKHNNTSVEKKLLGGEPSPIYNMYNQIGPQMGVDTVGDTVVGVASQLADEKRSLKCGGKTRRKAPWGTDAQGRRIWINDDTSTSGSTTSGPGNGGRNSYYGQTTGGNTSSITTPRGSNGGPGTGGRTGVGAYGGGGSDPGQMPNVSSSKSSGTRGYGSTRIGGGFGGWLSRNADLVGAGIGALGNIGGAFITAGANRSAAHTVADAQNRAANLMADAYRSLTGIDMNSIRREDYAAAHAMPALRAIISHSAQPLSQVDRRLQRTLANAGRYSTSGAAAQNRMARAEVDAQDARNQIYSADEQQKQETRNENVKSINEAAMLNAQLDTQANREYASAYLDALQYNNDINNQKILGAAGALSEGAINSANTMSVAQTSNAQAWANALLGGTQGFTSSLSAMADRKAKLASALLGAGSDSQASYYATLASRGEARQQYDALIAQYNAAKDEDTKKRLARQINNIASKRGFNLV